MQPQQQQSPMIMRNSRMSLRSPLLNSGVASGGIFGRSKIASPMVSSSSMAPPMEYMQQPVMYHQQQQQTSISGYSPRASSTAGKGKFNLCRGSKLDAARLTGSDGYDAASGNATSPIHLGAASTTPRVLPANNDEQWCFTVCIQPRCCSPACNSTKTIVCIPEFPPTTTMRIKEKGSTQMVFIW